MNSKGVKWAGLVVGGAAVMVTVFTIVVGIAMFVAGKADKSEVAGLKDSVHQIDKDVAVIKHEQRLLIRALRPELKVGKE